MRSIDDLKKIKFLDEEFNKQVGEYYKSIYISDLIDIEEVYENIKKIFYNCMNTCYFDFDMYINISNYDIKVKGIDDSTTYHVKYDNVYRESIILEPLYDKQIMEDRIEDAGMDILNKFVDSFVK